MAESKKMINREIAFMKAKGAPKDMLRHEKAEAREKGAKPFCRGGAVKGRKGR